MLCKAVFNNVKGMTSDKVSLCAIVDNSIKRF